MPLYTDTFDRADSSTLGTIPDSALTWQVVNGTWSISSNKPSTSTSPASNPIAVVDTANPDTDVSVTANGGDALYVRVVDAANWIRLRVDRYTVTTYSTEYEWEQMYEHDYVVVDHSSLPEPPSPYVYNYAWSNSSTNPPSFPSEKNVFHPHGGESHSHRYVRTGQAEYTGNSRQVESGTSTRYRLYLEKCVAGTVSTLASYSYSTSSPGSIRLRAVDNTLEGFWKGEATARVTATDATHGTATRHGIGRATTSVNSQALDNFTIETLNTAPDAPTPTAPADGETLNRQQDQEFRWQFNDPDPGDSQSAYNFAYRLVGATTWTETGWVALTSSKRVVTGGTFVAGDYEWRVRTKDAQGLESPWSATGFFTAGDPPAGPSITDPANNGTIPTAEYEVVWSTPDQDAYRLRVLDGTTVVYDTGQVDSTTARSRLVAFPDNGVTRTIELTVLFGGLWSPASTVTVTVSYTKPAEPTVALTSDDDDGSLIVTTTVQPPASGEPTVTGIDVWIREAGTAGDGLPVARDVPPSLDVTWWLPVSGVDYEARVRAIGDNGTSTWSQWYGRAPLTVAVYGQSTYDNAIYA